MHTFITLHRSTIKLKAKEISFVALKQSQIGICVREELASLLLIDTEDCKQMFILASLFKYMTESDDLIILERGKEEDCDLVIFNGAMNPLTFKDMQKIRSSIKYCGVQKQKLSLLNSHNESIWDEWNDWKYTKQLRVYFNGKLACINASKLGFELLMHTSAYLATSYAGHTHFDWNSTQSSLELIIRNIARN